MSNSNFTIHVRSTRWRSFTDDRVGWVTTRLLRYWRKNGASTLAMTAARLCTTRSTSRFARLSVTPSLTQRTQTKIDLENVAGKCWGIGMFAVPLRSVHEQTKPTAHQCEQETKPHLQNCSRLPKPLRYISLFSGIGVAELAIKRVFPTAVCLGYAETDADALLIYRKHYPNHENLGNVENIDGVPFRGLVDLIIGGSPCQGFSKIGKQRGFRDSRSRLFSEFARLVRETEARYFVFENVRSMHPAIKETISAELGITPVTLDSSLFTPQVRRRLYWCNFPVTIPPQCVVPPLSSILIENHCMKDLSGNVFRGIAASAIIANRPPGASRIFALTTVGHYNAGMGSRNDDKANTVTTILNDLQVIFDGKIVRRLDCVEAERLQGLPDGYTSGLPRVRRWKCIGNSFTCDSIVHILQCLEAEL
ncbi:S-adenosyl-L-methionine-dependent methyltransferase [Geranomyces variabilis]|nr:S-adenosyl-L-methionine-dependent methyltransferase [Geranomyces variabilis]